MDREIKPGTLCLFQTIYPEYEEERCLNGRTCVARKFIGHVEDGNNYMDDAWECEAEWLAIYERPVISAKCLIPISDPDTDVTTEQRDEQPSGVTA